jgi:hypothetical protein
VAPDRLPGRVAVTDVIGFAMAELFGHRGMKMIDEA